MIKNHFEGFVFYINTKQVLTKINLHKVIGGSPGNRTRDTMIKSHVLYRLS